MNYRLVSKYLGYFSFALAAMMAIPILWGIYFSETHGIVTLGLSMATSAIVGAILTILGRDAPDTLFQREALALVSLSWFVAAILGALPFVYGGWMDPVSAFFEAMSGFTTTGATAIEDIEAVDLSVLFWRSMTQWLGGAGIVVLFIAVLPYLGSGGKQLFMSESSGPDPHGLKPRVRDTAALLYRIYLGLTLLMTAALMFAGMSFYDALSHTMTTISSGGFSPKQASIAAYDSVSIELIIIFFMGAAGTSFALFFTMWEKDWRAPFKDSEWRIFVGIFLLAFVLVTANLVYGTHIHADGTIAQDHYTWLHAARESAFHSMSIFTGTGYVIDDFDPYPSFSKTIFLVLMFTGGCAGSTTGGLKIVRLIMLAKIAYWRIESTFRPKTVRAIRIGDHVIDDDVRKSVHTFFVVYIAWFVFGCLVMSALGLPLETAISSVAATLNNIGPGYEHVGAIRDYSEVPAFGKLFLSLCMVLGRLEMFSICVLFVPAFWKHS